MYNKSQYVSKYFRTFRVAKPTKETNWLVPPVEQGARHGTPAAKSLN
jgi:hypothetical protein